MHGSADIEIGGLPEMMDAGEFALACWPFLTEYPSKHFDSSVHANCHSAMRSKWIEKSWANSQLF